MLIALPTAAQAAKPSGSPVALISIGKTSKGLRGPGVKVKAIKPMVVRSKLAGFPISDVAVNGTAAGSFVLRGGFLLSKGKRKVKITGLLVSVKRSNVTVTGRIGRKRLKIFSGKASTKPTIDGGRVAVAVRVTKLTATSAAVKRVRSALKSRSPKSRFVGKLSADAAVVAPPISGESSVSREAAATCAPATAAVTDPAKPGSAVNLSCGFLTWHVRDSWIGYLPINVPVAPAAALPPINGNEHVCPTAGSSAVDAYSFSLPFSNGWWDSATATGALYSTGGIHFRHDDHGLNVRVMDVELRLNGAASTLKLTVFDSANPGGARIDFATMNATAPLAGGPVAPSTPVSRLTTSLTEAASAGPLGGFYAPGESFGCMDFGFNG